MIILILTIILISLIFIFCGDKGARSIITTIANALLLLGALFLIYRGMPPLIVVPVVCLIMTALILFYQNEKDVKSSIAFMSVAIVLFILIPLVYWLASKGNSEGFNPEQYEITDSNGYTRNIHLSMLSLQISIMIIALLGTVIDIAVAVISSIYEIYRATPNISKTRLMASGFKVSRAVLNTSIHTIFYIYIAEYLTLFIQYVSDYTWSALLNSKSLFQELVSVSVSGLGCCLIVPVATVMAVLIVGRNRKNA